MKFNFNRIYSSIVTFREGGKNRAIYLTLPTHLPLLPFSPTQQLALAGKGKERSSQGGWLLKPGGGGGSGAGFPSGSTGVTGRETGKQCQELAFS